MESTVHHYNLKIISISKDEGISLDKAILIQNANVLHKNYKAGSSFTFLKAQLHRVIAANNIKNST